MNPGNLLPFLYCALIVESSVPTNEFNETTEFMTTLVNKMTNVYNQLIGVNYTRQVAPYSPVYFDYQINDLNDFDEVNGKLQTIGDMYVTWHDVRLEWSEVRLPRTNGGEVVINHTFIPIKELWHPDILLFNPVWRMILFDKDRVTISALVNNTGWVKIILSDLLTTSCHPNVKWFPFDSHHCVLDFTSSSSLNRIQFFFREGDGIFRDNSKWIYYQMKPCVKNRTSKDNITQPLTNYFLRFPIHLIRRSAFSLMSTLVPLLILSYLNLLVFYIPPKSAERSTFCITLLLSITVYLIYVSDIIPETSNPVPNIMLVLVFKLAVSAFIALTSFVSCRINDWNPHMHVMSKTIEKLTRSLRKVTPRHTKHEFQGMQREDGNMNIFQDFVMRRGNIVLTGSDQTSTYDNTTEPPYSNRVSAMSYISNDTSGKQTTENDKVTWSDVSNLIDKICFWVALLLVLSETILLLVVQITKTDDLVKHMEYEDCSTFV